jgi:hypothetical protein
VGQTVLIGPCRSRLRAVRSVLAVLLSTACVAGRPLPAPLPTPPGGGLPPRDALLELGRGQVYDTNHGAAARAIVSDGIEVTIQPQDGAYRQSEARLGQGAIVAVLINHSGKPLSDLALPPGGRSYWVVYRQKGEWLSAFIADAPGDRQLDRVAVPTTIHPAGRPWRQSIAQWQLAGVLERTRPGGDVAVLLAMQPWVSCMELGCCRPGI